MIPLLEQNQEALRGLCRRFGVERFEVFGSGADGNFDPARSDLDFLVEFTAMEPGPLADAYFGLLRELELLFNRKIDLVTPRAIRNPFFLESVNRTRRMLYAA